MPNSAKSTPKAKPDAGSGGGGGSSASGGGGGVKRKRDGNAAAHFLDAMKTPDTPYGGPEASSVSRKVWKKVKVKDLRLTHF